MEMTVRHPEKKPLTATDLDHLGALVWDLIEMGAEGLTVTVNYGYGEPDVNISECAVAPMSERELTALMLTGKIGIEEYETRMDTARAQAER